MKITGIKIYNHTVPYVRKHRFTSRVCSPLDIFDEYNDDVRSKGFPMGLRYGDGALTGAFVAVTTDEGPEGIFGPIEYRAQLLVAAESIASCIVGRDPLENRHIWDVMSRFDRHSRSGIMLMAISAVDIALWDLKGKILGQPVYKLLGGGRGRVKPYASMLGFSVEPGEAKETALAVKERGFGAQKWFFRYGPASGHAGMRKNLELARMLRETLGDGYDLMFDCWMGWTIQYALTIFRELEAVAPLWMEEVLRPHMQDGYRILKANSSVPLSAGEHMYLRHETAAYLREGIFCTMQADPDWCGGITEAVRIGDLCEMYGTTFVPHGNSLMPAAHVVASMPPDVCPYAEYLIHYMEDDKEPYFSTRWLDDDCMIPLVGSPGLGLVPDRERITHTEEIREFRF